MIVTPPWFVRLSLLDSERPADSEDWQDISDIRAEPSPMKVSGWVIAQTDRFLKIAQVIDKANGRCSGVLLVPRSAIVRPKCLRVNLPK